VETRTLTILFTDIKGYTEATARLSREEHLAMLHGHRDFVRPWVEHHGGRVVKGIGDAFLAVFESPTNAVLCGMDLQKALRDHNADLPADRRTEIRVAINTGEVALDEGDVFGEAVNIAARIESIAEPNEVYFTEATYLSMNKAEVPSAEVGYRTLKGIREQVRVYRVLWERPGLGVSAAAPASAAPVPASAVSVAPAGRQVAGPLWRRAIAFAIDLVPPLLVAGLVGDEGLGLLLLIVLYHAGLHRLGWRPVGKRLLGLRVVGADGGPVRARRVALRSACYAVSVLPFGIGFLWPLWDARGRAVHDLIAETLVVRA
jgi:class 3 adenylate cyclase/uncharacterized RDD family membrane protein YckC